MKRPRTLQELIHWLELGGGARWVRLAAVLLLTLLVSLRVAWTQFQGPASEAVLVQADVGRQLARGEGFTTQVNYPQTAAVLEKRGQGFDAKQAYPELHQAPLYSLVIAAGLAVLPADAQAALFNQPPVPPDGFRADYYLLGLNVVLLWLAAWLTFDLGRRLFEPRVGWVAALGLLLSMPLWKQTVSVNGLPLLLVLSLAAFRGWWQWDEAVSSARKSAIGWAAALGGICGLLFLAEYSAGALLPVVLAAALWRLRAGNCWMSAGAMLGACLLVTGPWMARNLLLTGHPMALAGQNVALKAGDSTAEPKQVRATLSAQAPSLDLNKLGNKTLTSLSDSLSSRIWSGGALWFTAFYIVGWFYRFRDPAAERLRWWFTLGLGVLILAQAVFNSGESQRLPVYYLAPLLIIFGAAFFFVLLGGNPLLAKWPRAAAGLLLVLQAVPLLHDLLEPRRLHFHYPPYFPGLFMGMGRDLESRGVQGRFGLMADVPAGVAWYGDQRVWAQPVTMRDFMAVSLEQPIGQLLLTPQTLDRPFFSELAANAGGDGARLTGLTRHGEWGGVYAGLLTGRMPRNFPLQAPQRLSENLYVLFDPSLPPPRGK
ncbi:MAG TPA: hypothetical protein PLF88_02130 [Opitutaceae bacterium]|mgnify:CR=1 FL=1|nr:hypothetical protein [Opitutaceae bacterium]HRJ47659.1 hypothetical protein [Opitutaceae bacterium]